MAGSQRAAPLHPHVTLPAAVENCRLLLLLLLLLPLLAMIVPLPAVTPSSKILSLPFPLPLGIQEGGQGRGRRGSLDSQEVRVRVGVRVRHLPAATDNPTDAAGAQCCCRSVPLQLPLGVIGGRGTPVSKWRRL